GQGAHPGRNCRAGDRREPHARIQSRSGLHLLGRGMVVARDLHSLELQPRGVPDTETRAAEGKRGARGDEDPPGPHGAPGPPPAPRRSGGSNEPIRRTSGVSRTPVRSNTAACTSTRSRWTSWAVAPGRARKKLACLSDTSAPPARCPFIPASSIRRPAEPPAGLPAGFLNIDPALRASPGWV